MLTWKPYTVANPVVSLLVVLFVTVLLFVTVVSAIVAFVTSLLLLTIAKRVTGEVTDQQQMLVWMTLHIRTSTTAFPGPPSNYMLGGPKRCSECSSRHNM